MLIVNAEIDGASCDVRICDGRIAAILPRAARPASGDFIDAQGCALLPGLHDHHLHLNAAAAALGSVDCGPAVCRDMSALLTALRAAPGTGWIRGIGYHDSIAGQIDRDWLDRLELQRPIRIQHRSGRLWMLNSAAIDLLGEGAPSDGRLLDRDDWLRDRLPSSALDLTPVGALLAQFGVTGVTEATPRNGRRDFDRYVAARLPQRLRIMGSAELDGLAPAGRSEVGEVKLHYHDHDLPALDELAAKVACAHAAGRAVASHCVTLPELMLTLSAIEAAGVHHGDRIEHAAIVPPDLADWIAALGLTVVTQPHFLAERGDAYARDVPEADCRWLYRVGGLIRASIPVAGGSDAPFGGLNPWASMAAAVNRPRGFGTDDELVDPETALGLYLGRPEKPGAIRSLTEGTIADLCLLDRPWRIARENLAAVKVVGTWVEGKRCHG